MNTKLFLTTITLLMLCSTLIAHPGRLDRNGGHKGPGGYHYHKGGGHKGGNGRGDSAPKVKAREVQVIILADRSEKVYHRKSCEKIKGKQILSMSWDEARNLGYKECGVCK
ncbi:MAG: hypothetical protein FWH53_00205 [Leptospirales bacterium]|nr:hypothetical protein [Leptospirales bacterium]